ncbi:MAG: thioredoxin [Flavobacteriaceae bacterium]|nr:thioredoxin [Flavobacteriaceae bacterium]
MIATIILITIAAILIIALIVLNKFKKAPMVENHEKILVLTDQNFDQSIQNKTVLVDFWAEWCMPCKVMAPILNDLSGELPDGKYIGKIDIEKYPKMSQKYGIRGIPTLVLFENGKEIDRFVGVKQKTFLKSKMLG